MKTVAMSVGGIRQIKRDGIIEPEKVEKQN